MGKPIFGIVAIAKAKLRFCDCYILCVACDKDNEQARLECEEQGMLMGLH